MSFNSADDVRACPECSQNGLSFALQYIQISFEDATLMCLNRKMMSGTFPQHQKKLIRQVTHNLQEVMLTVVKEVQQLCQSQESKRACAYPIGWPKPDDLFIKKKPPILKTPPPVARKRKRESSENEVNEKQSNGFIDKPVQALNGHNNSKISSLLNGLSRTYKNSRMENIQGNLGNGNLGNGNHGNGNHGIHGNESLIDTQSYMTDLDLDDLLAGMNHDDSVTNQHVNESQCINGNYFCDGFSGANVNVNNVTKQCSDSHLEILPESLTTNGGCVDTAEPGIEEESSSSSTDLYDNTADNMRVNESSSVSSLVSGTTALLDQINSKQSIPEQNVNKSNIPSSASDNFTGYKERSESGVPVKRSTESKEKRGRRGGDMSQQLLTFLQWENQDALCWLDVVLALLVHNKCVRAPACEDLDRKLKSFPTNHSARSHKDDNGVNVRGSSSAISVSSAEEDEVVVVSQRGSRRQAQVERCGEGMIKRLMRDYDVAQMLHRQSVELRRCELLCGMGRTVRLETCAGNVTVKIGGGSSGSNLVSFGSPCVTTINMDSSVLSALSDSQDVCQTFESFNINNIVCKDSGTVVMEKLSEEAARLERQARSVLSASRERVYSSIESSVGCVRGKNDSALVGLMCALEADAEVLGRVGVKYHWSFTCNQCGHQQNDTVEKSAPTLLRVGNDFSMTRPSFYRQCFECNASDQLIDINIDTLPDTMFTHFLEGLPVLVADDLDFERDDLMYCVTGVIRYQPHPAHFIAWLRDPINNQWMEYDDLRNSVCKYSHKAPLFPPCQAHIVMWERQSLATADLIRARRLHDQNGFKTEIKVEPVEISSDPVSCRVNSNPGVLSGVVKARVIPLPVVDESYGAGVSDARSETFVERIQRNYLNYRKSRSDSVAQSVAHGVVLPNAGDTIKPPTNQVQTTRETSGLTTGSMSRNNSLLSSQNIPLPHASVSPPASPPLVDPPSSIPAQSSLNLAQLNKVRAKYSSAPAVARPSVPSTNQTAVPVFLANQNVASVSLAHQKSVSSANQKAAPAFSTNQNTAIDRLTNGISESRVKSLGRLKLLPSVQPIVDKFCKANKATARDSSHRMFEGYKSKAQQNDSVVSGGVGDSAGEGEGTTRKHKVSFDLERNENITRNTYNSEERKNLKPVKGILTSSLNSGSRPSPYRLERVRENREQESSVKRRDEIVEDDWTKDKHLRSFVEEFKSFDNDSFNEFFNEISTFVPDLMNAQLPDDILNDSKGSDISIDSETGIVFQNGCTESGTAFQNGCAESGTLFQNGCSEIGAMFRNGFAEAGAVFQNGCTESYNKSESLSNGYVNGEVGSLSMTSENPEVIKSLPVTSNSHSSDCLLEPIGMEIISFDSSWPDLVL